MTVRNFLFAELAERTNSKNRDWDYYDRRGTFIESEFEELIEALRTKDPVEYIDASLDIVVLAMNNVYHYLRDQGLNQVRAGAGTLNLFDEVINSNMTKVDADGKVSFNSMGKIIKPNNYRPPEIETMLKKILTKYS